MIVLNFLTIMILPVALGYCLIKVFDKKKLLPLTFSLALAYGLGTGLLTLWMFLLGVLRLPLTITTTNYPAALLFIICFLFMLKSRDQSFNKRSNRPLSFRHLDPVSIVLILFILLQVSYVFWRAFTVPISTWDAIATHTFNAKVLFYEQSLKYANNLPHSNYPLHVPLLQAWVALNTGAWDDQIIQGVFPLYFLSTLAIMYYFLRNHTRARWALLGLVFLASAPFLTFHATIGYRDLPLLYYNYTAIVLLLLWSKKKEPVYLILASLFGGITSFVKLEGTGYLLVHILLLMTILAQERALTIIEKFKTFLKFVIPSLSICLSFHIYRYLSLAGKASSDNLSFNLYTLGLDPATNYLQRLKIVLGKIGQNLFFSNNWNILWLILVISLLRLNRKNFSFEVKLLCLTLILVAGIYLPAFTLTQHYYWITQTSDVLSRCILHIFPLVPTLIILINFPKES